MKVFKDRKVRKMDKQIENMLKIQSSGASAYLDYNKVDPETQKKMLALFPITSKKRYWIEKRAFDITFALLTMMILSPLMAATAVAVYIDDPHASPIFTQNRNGRHGKEFKMYKFRSMVANAESMKKDLQNLNEADGPAFKIRNDPRITKVGKFIRATSIDELPQFFNVLKGDMCMVGPRPPLPEEFATYTDYQKLRLVVTPGITCIWQTTPNRNDIPFDEWVQMDLDYIEHRSFWGDIWLMLKTAITMIKREGR